MRWTRHGWRACAAATLTATLTACATTTGIGGSDGGGDSGRSAAPVDVAAAACRLFGPIAWSRADTDATIGAVKGHNAAYDALCAGGDGGL